MFYLNGQVFVFVGCFTLFDGYRHCYGRLDIKILLERKPGFHSFGMSISFASACLKWEMSASILLC